MKNFFQSPRPDGRRSGKGLLPASLMLSPEMCDPGGIRPGVPPPELGDRASSFPSP